MSQLSRSAELNVTLLQKNYGKYKPVKGYNRFPKDQQTAEIAFTEFIKKDITKPLEKPKPPRQIFTIPEEKWALGTDKKSASIEKVPKLQQFKDYNFANRDTGDINSYRSYFLPTDHINIKVPKIEKKEDKDSFLILKSKFGQHSESQKPWLPIVDYKTVNNRSGVDYNIINHTENRFSGALVVTVSDRKVMNKKKGIAEIADLMRPFNPNFNKEYTDMYNENNKIFHSCKGIFSHMYDAAHRNGNIIMPFANDVKNNKAKNH
jgi:hypothetical protein